MRRLVYNQVWEDYEVDRAALDVGRPDVVLMITSGGCNVLNTLTESPRRIVAIDANAGQRDLLQHKLDIIRRGDYRDLWRTYGTPAQRTRPSIYGRGAYGRFAWVRAYFHMMCGADAIRRFTQSPSLSEQREIYLRSIEPRLWNRATRVLPAALAGVCGMHWRQVGSTFTAERFLLESICRVRLRHVLTSFPIRDNYYWHQMLTGAYASRSHCPPYLRPRQFKRLRQLTNRVDNLTGDVVEYLRGVPDDTFTRVSLLDVPEFISPRRRAVLFGELRRVCAPGARIVYRSFAPNVPVPAEHNSGSPGKLRFEHALSPELTRRERTASYGAVHLYTLCGADGPHR